MKERAFSDGLKQATDPHPHPKKSMHQGIDPAHPVTRSKTPPRLCASARDSPVPNGAASPPYRTASREPAPEPLRNRAQPSTSSGRAGRTLSTRSFEIWTVPVEAPRGFLMFLIWQQETAATPPPRALL